MLCDIRSHRPKQSTIHINQSTLSSFPLFCHMAQDPDFTAILNRLGRTPTSTHQSITVKSHLRRAAAAGEKGQEKEAKVGFLHLTRHLGEKYELVCQTDHIWGPPYKDCSKC